jgi:integrase
MSTPGNITRRGQRSWRLKFEAGDRDPITGKRRTRFVTMRGTKKSAQAELIRLLAEVDSGTSINPSKQTVGEYVHGWLEASTHLAPKTLERYAELSRCQIVPHLGSIILQKLRPSHIAEWHATLLKSGGRNGHPLAPRTVGHAHRVLHSALARAAKVETVSRNVASVLAPPKVESHEIESLTDLQIADILTRLETHTLYPIVVTALGTGMRRGELCGLQWRDVDLDQASIGVERSLEETNAGLRVKSPKSRHGRRRISLPASVVETLRAHRVRQIEMRLALGMGRPEPEALVFCREDGLPLSPDRLSQQWRRLVDAMGLPSVSFHALRHTHASALIGAGLDVISVSRRLGHGSPAITLTIYAHRFASTDTAAASAMDLAMRKR